MQREQLVVGVDIGTTSTKAVAFGPEGRILGNCTVSYPLIRPRPSRVEQDPDEIFRAVISALRGALDQANAGGDDVRAVGVSSAMHSLLALDHRGRPLTRSIIWADNRSEDQARRLKEIPKGQALYRRTGTPVHPMSPLTKLMWLRERDPDIFRQADRFVSIKEYVLFRLFGSRVVDHSIASATGLFNLETLDWDEEALDLAGVNRRQLFTPVPTTHVLEGLDSAHARDMGLSPRTPWVIGAGDGVLANLGCGAVRPGVAAVTIGTSGAVRLVTDQPRMDARGRTFCYALTDRLWVIGGPTNNGGILLRWMREVLERGEEEDEPPSPDAYFRLLSVAESIPPGSDGLLFLPFLSGERAPHWNERARGVFAGLSLHHTQGHLIRGMMEGMMLNLYAITSALEDLAGPLKEVRASGGFVRSPFLLQMLADVLGREVLVPEVYEASALGAALLALHSLGEVKELTDIGSWSRILHRFRPDPETVQIYRELFTVYERMYHKIEPELETLARFQNRR